MLRCKSHPLKGRFLTSLVIASLLITFFSLYCTAAEVRSYADNWGTDGFNLIRQDAAGVEVVFSITRLALSEVKIDDEIMYKPNLPGIYLPNDAGAPDLSGTGRYIALPQHAFAELEILDYQTETILNIDIAPAFKIPSENDDSPLVYEKNRTIYDTDGFYPADPIRLSEPAKLRGIDVVILGITPFQYNPVTQELVVYYNVRVQIHFRGGNDHFGEDRLRSRWWEPVLEQNILNYETLPQVHRRPQGPETDEDNVEYLIIVPDDPDFIAWADTLKRWRNEQGIITGVTRLSEIGGNDFNLIEDYITNAYTSWTIPPVAVLLLSDYQATGSDRYGITTGTYQGMICTCESDNLYADVDGDHLPDINCARITAQDNEHLSNMIGKMLAYEREPCTDPNFYVHPLMTGGWQIERWFILTNEILHGFFTNIHGREPVREYDIYWGYPPDSVWSTNPNTGMILDYFGPTGLGYVAASPSYLTDWTGNATGINNAINSGAFLVQYRDHGSIPDWHAPYYNTSHVNFLTNTAYPYIFSTTCGTGMFNSEWECLAEAFHRSPHGALGVHAASYESYSFVNDTYVYGMYDSMWPDFDPGYGLDPYGEDNLRPGFASVSGKYYLEASSWPWNPEYKEPTYYVFHHHGDAFMTLYSEVPQYLTVDHEATIVAGSTTFAVTADNGALIGLSAGGDYLGAAEGTGAPVAILINGLPYSGAMRVTVTRANYYRYMADVEITGGSPPDVILQLTYQSGSPVPPGGGNLIFDIYLENASGLAQDFDAWIDISYEGGEPTTVLLRSFSDFQPGWIIDRPNSYFPVPGSYAAGNYTLTGRVGVHPDEVWNESGFPFEKSGVWDGGEFIPFSVDNAPNPFDEIVTVAPEATTPLRHVLLDVHPNPFNPVTTFRIELPVASWVTLEIFDVSGRSLGFVLDGLRSAGYHEATFDASGLASGVYLYRLQTSESEATPTMVTGKMVLMK